VVNLASGKMLATTNKAWLMPKHNAVVAFTGQGVPSAAIQDVLQFNTEGFDELEARAGDLMARWYDHVRRACPASFLAIVAGLSESRGPSAFVVRSDDCPVQTHLPAWQSVGTGWIIQPGYDGMGGVHGASFDVEAFDPVRDGIRIMEAQRVHIEPPPIGTGHPQVGGFIQHTEITADGIRTRIMHRWPDEVGRVIAA
jgi:hypothetical protein